MNTILTNDDLKNIEKLLEAKEKRLKKKIETVDLKVETLDKKVNTLDLKVATLHELNKQAHSEIVDMLVESNDINGKQLKELEERMDALENQVSTHKN